MIDFLYDVIAGFDQITREPTLLIILAVWFFIARFIGKLTVEVTWPKALFLLVLFSIIWADLWSAHPVFIVTFFAGILSNHIQTIRGILGWSEGISDMLFAIRHRFAYAEIRRLEEENETLKAQLRAAQMQDGGQSNTQQKWKQQARSWRSKGDGSAGGQTDGGRGAQGKTYGSRFSQGSDSTSSKASGKQRSQYTSSSNSKPRGASSAQGQSGSQKQSSSSSQSRSRGSSGQSQGASQSQSSTQSKPSFTFRDQHLQTLGLRPGQSYSAAEIKAAWRKRAKETHPDAGGSQVAFMAVVNAYNALK